MAAAILAQVASLCNAGKRFANLHDRTPPFSRAERMIVSMSESGPSMISFTAARARPRLRKNSTCACNFLLDGALEQAGRVLKALPARPECIRTMSTVEIRRAAFSIRTAAEPLSA